MIPESLESSDEPLAPDVIRGMVQIAPDMDPAAIAAADRLIRLAFAEDLGELGDLTSAALIPDQTRGSARFVARSPGMLCGLGVCRLIMARWAPELTLETRVRDGDAVEAGDVLAVVRGPARSILLVERTCLNFLGHLSGISSLTRRFVNAIQNPSCVLLDTRKTLPGWRALAKYAVRCGGGRNHRLGLYDGILIKDNHLALCRDLPGAELRRVDQAIQQARRWLESKGSSVQPRPPIEVEVDSVEQLRLALAAGPDIVLLDNMKVAELRECVELRNQVAPRVLLEASGGIRLENIGAISQTGVDRISVGQLTHSAPNLDIALDWNDLA